MIRRAEGVTISWYPEDRETLRADAKRAGLSVSAYLRGLWLAARPREVTAGAWEERVSECWVRVGSGVLATIVPGARNPYRWEAWDGKGGEVGYAPTPEAARDAADAWLRSRGVVLA